MAYWTTSQQEIEAHISKALFCSEQLISVPCINMLSVQSNAEFDNTSMLEDEQFQNDSSDEELELDSSPCSTDTDEDESTD